MPLFPTKLLLIVVTMLHSFHFIYANKTTVLCYMVAWASSRPNEGKFKIKDADTQHCTHIVYAFMGLNGTTSTIHSIDPKFDHEMGGQGEGQLKQLKELKTFNQNLKVLASIGGYNQGSVNFSEMARSTTKRGDFINSIVKFIRDYKLDGIDICWQHPGYKGGRAEDRRNFISLLKLDTILLLDAIKGQSENNRSIPLKVWPHPGRLSN